MRVLIINTYDRGGGAALAAFRLADALTLQGADVRILVADKTTTRADVASIGASLGARLRQKMAFYAERLGIFIANGLNRSTLFEVSTALYGSNINAHPWVKDWADVIHLHWINHGFLSLSGIRKLSQTNKPVVWTMHDMWPATSICHHARQCLKYTEPSGCRACPRINSRRTYDLASRVAHRKAIALQHLSPAIVGCSEWIADCARRSIYTSRLLITDIPNPIDTTLFSPINRAEARKRLSLPNDPNHCYLLFGAVRADDKRKGIEQMASALAILYQHYPDLRRRLSLIVFGRLSDEAAALLTYFPIHPVGYIDDPQRMAWLYNAADLFVTPSLEENLPNTIMESLACGTPCIGFRVGGIPEMILHGSNGYVADYASPTSLAENIARLYHTFISPNTNTDSANPRPQQTDTNPMQRLRQDCRTSVLQRYERSIVADRYLSLYKTLLDEPAHNA